mmetsp:Transcript_28609/g.40248  ORF Transcript_28609/g.40248 Transcript_28609/m.40248 type:complete len:258 (-) Transcript_28609:256-1029(-)
MTAPWIVSGAIGRTGAAVQRHAMGGRRADQGRARLATPRGSRALERRSTPGLVARTFVPPTAWLATGWHGSPAASRAAAVLQSGSAASSSSRPMAGRNVPPRWSPNPAAQRRSALSTASGVSGASGRPALHPVVTRPRGTLERSLWKPTKLGRPAPERTRRRSHVASWSAPWIAHWPSGLTGQTAVSLADQESWRGLVPWMQLRSTAGRIAALRTCSMRRSIAAFPHAPLIASGSTGWTGVVARPAAGTATPRERAW